MVTVTGLGAISSLMITSCLAVLTHSVLTTYLDAPGPSPAGICSSVVQPYGYSCEEHTVTTKDGYILSVQRIPHGKRGSKISGQPVLLQHGVLMDGLTWLLNPPDQSLAYVLAESGFDVWIPNTRGTHFSRAHTSLQPTDPAYWNWSWDELAAYDLPAVFGYVHGQTGQKINYVGHSQGTLMALASFSQGKLMDTVRSAALLSPIAYLSHMSSAIGQLAAKAFVGEVTNWLGIAEFNPKGQAVAKFLKALCANPGIDCYDLMTSFTGKNCCLNSSTVELFLRYEPQSSSSKNMVHLAQMVRNGKIEMYNYGNPNDNMKHYGQADPPTYNMSNIPRQLPLFLSYGGQDALSVTKDVELLQDSLKFHEGDELTVQYIDNYAHADFVMGVSAKHTVYDPLIAFFNRH
ncbi:triacylglycerol lipase 2 [Amborella trichopoda]|uniref:Lipase n=1 Tax=Amborella trichopoda TaxID=13333 RepID=W1NMY6_AMBTC|nr:triacylglycerol lipase 2 [Amborella trichopoda]ERM96918.1 hypothetical protein AMTR_s00074p00116330 [Amborella trichopoda]|eukprot:XP_006829502.1 triacylglycerol lipase 2 [Amborella trichopoda]